ncbi:class I SAM-dependent methyltransferase [Aequorivita vitellina]|nr:class I SAM-dependent methyltransferase [Aequorivita vitellina]
MKCTLCETNLHTMADAYYFVCDSCGAYVKDKKYYLSPEEEKARYLTHENNLDDAGYKKFTSPITEAILKNQNAEQLGLDYGCGTGPVISKQLRDKKFQVNLYDPFFRVNTSYLNHCYDYIFSCEVFEHFHKPKEEIEKLLGILKPGGRLYIMTHIYNSEIDFEGWYYRNDPTHVFIYTFKTMAFIANTYNLKVEVMTDRLLIGRW